MLVYIHGMVARRGRRTVSVAPCSHVRRYAFMCCVHLATATQPAPVHFHHTYSSVKTRLLPVDTLYFGLVCTDYTDAFSVYLQQTLSNNRPLPMDSIPSGLVPSISARQQKSPRPATRFSNPPHSECVFPQLTPLQPHPRF